MPNYTRSSADNDWGAIFKKLGAVPIINAIGSLTLLGGSTPPIEVLQAMEAANGAYIPLTELEYAVGAIIAKETNVPAAYVTAGAGSALTLAAAAAMAGDDDAKIEQLPNTIGMKNEILIQKRHRYWYDRCLETSGATLVDFGTANGTSADDLRNAIGRSTAAVHFVMKEESPDSAALSLEETIAIADEAGLPTLVDAAGQVYPLENLGKYVRMGAAFTCVAAKYIGAPQSTGLALGTSEFIRKLGLQSFASYEGRRIRGIGRPHKIDRQEIVGCVAAVRRWMILNHEERLADAEQRSMIMVNALAGIPGVSATFIENVIGHHAFGVKLDVDPVVTGLTNQGLVDRLKQGVPPIWTRIRDHETFIILTTFGLKPGEEQIVADRIAELF
jgi:D-glucosaminate-6-phosphate ammonia-lyase